MKVFLSAARHFFLTNLLLAIGLHAQAPYDCESRSQRPLAEVTPQYPFGLDWHVDRLDQRWLPLDGLSLLHPQDENLSVDIYVMDTGIQPFHPAIYPRVAGGFSPFDDEFGWLDDNGHGTAVASVLLQTAPTSGIRLWSVRVFKNGEGNSASLAEGVNWIAGMVRSQPSHRHIVNYSGGGPPNSVLDAAFCELIEDGAEVFVAAGNTSNTACLISPARVVQLTTLAASNEADRPASFASQGPCVDLFAPGVNIRAADLDGTYSIWAGSSFSAPLASGLAARGPNVLSTTSGVIEEPEVGTPNLLLYGGYILLADSWENGDFGAWSDVCRFADDCEEVP